MTGAISPRSVGASVPRFEDKRYLNGKGSYIADLPLLPGTLEVAFVRSEHARADIRGISGPPELAKERLFTATNFTNLDGLAAVSRLTDYVNHVQPLIVTDRARYPGEIIAAVLADSRAEAEDLAERVIVDATPLQAVVNIAQATAPGAPVANDDIPGNRIAWASAKIGDIEQARKQAAATYAEHFDLARCAGVPMENRGVVAAWDERSERLTVWSSTQVAHLLRSQLAKSLRMPERQIRVVAPDVGGGFGIKCNLYPEDVLIASMAIQLKRPVRWLSDRREDLLASWTGREHSWDVEAYAAADGEILGMKVSVSANVGAYSPTPWTAAMEANMAAGVMPGPYQIQTYHVDILSVCSNTPPMGPYRGVGRPGACFAMERIMDELAHQLGMSPVSIRMRNMIRQDQFPYTSVTGMIYDSGSFEEALERAAAGVKFADFRERQQAALEQGRYLGIGFANYTEQTAHGTPEWVARGLPIILSYESADISMDPSGEVTVAVGTHSHGQGHETTFAQVTADALGIDPRKVRIAFGDTDVSPYGIGTFASRSAVTTGAAIHEAATQIRNKLQKMAAMEMEVSPEDLELVDEGFRIKGTQRKKHIKELAPLAYHRVDLLPPGERPGLHAISYLEANPGTGTFSNACHATVVEVDPDTGGVEILDYLVIEDCGQMINPMIVEGQVHGGTLQGIGGAILEEIAYSQSGQPLVTTLLSYLIPSTSDSPSIRVEHLETPSDTVLGLKGMGEGGAIAPGGALANAVADALRPLNARINKLPIKPSTVWASIPRSAA